MLSLLNWNFRRTDFCRLRAAYIKYFVLPKDTVDSFLKFADFFFDGLFADWAVLDHINQAQSRVENTKGQIKRVLALLKKMREDVDVQIADEKEKQEQLAVETEL